MVVMTPGSVDSLSEVVGESVDAMTMVEKLSAWGRDMAITVLAIMTLSCMVN